MSLQYGFPPCERPLISHLHIPVQAEIQPFCERTGSPELSNEVQHQIKVLPWNENTTSFRWKTAVRLPRFVARGVRFEAIDQRSSSESWSYSRSMATP